MKKIVCLIVILLCGCENKEPIPKQYEEPQAVIEDYVDNNPITIGIYHNTLESLNLISEYKEEWISKKDISVLTIALTNEEKIFDYYYQDIWNKYYKTYNNIDNYKVGYYISFTLKDGTFLEKTILSPRDMSHFYPYLSIYLYDDVHQEKGTWYRHIEEQEIKDDTIFTTIKLTAEEQISEINTPITLTTFTYDDENDFSNDRYKGNSSYSILIKRK